MTDDTDDVDGIETLPEEHRPLVRRVTRPAERWGSDPFVTQSEHNDPPRYQLRFRYTGSTWDMEKGLPLDQFVLYLRGLDHGQQDEIERQVPEEKGHSAALSETLSEPDDVNGIETLPEEHRPLVRRVAEAAETGKSDLFVTQSGPNSRYRLRLWHPDSCTSDIGPRLPLDEFALYLRGLDDGLRGEVERRAKAYASD